MADGGNPYGVNLLPIKPGSSGIALPGVDVAVMTPEGEECGTDEKGIMVIRRPFPGLTATLWGEVERYAADYWGKVPGRTEYQRGILFRQDGEWRVRITGQQGSGVLRSMAEANCFIVLEHERGAVKAGEAVQVQLMEGLA